ncbi:ligand-binding sensor domain-containing protein [Flavilitoribacter nigricans]|uniref:Uncharacterized protein n=1 Tax=Flavilitoribacter nigricans (strain ATCC 23147 / DSM 23189 / NBRC 102662 / NCIMB 1420 / SS-2) TaxID=1122177 RepID=A0A2D0NDD0_FLAN2|nr:hypothetical protein CRP01_11865 [Flavilitoribacter nigricans DSM 23189 = NBRC 102662]
MGLLGCGETNTESVSSENRSQEIHQDTPFIQDYSIKYTLEQEDTRPLQIASDRNGAIRVLSTAGLLLPRKGQFLYPGTLVPDTRYRTSKHKIISGITSYDQQLVYVDQQAVYSNAWAGKLFDEHALSSPRLIAGGPDLSFLISDGTSLELLQNGNSIWKGEAPAGTVEVIRFDPQTAAFWVLGADRVDVFSPESQSWRQVYTAPDLTALAVLEDKLVLGTSDGFLYVDKSNGEPIGAIQRRLPATDISCIREIDGRLWFGSDMGAFALREDGTYDYYHGERWIPGSAVIDITAGPEQSVLILTDEGLAQIHFDTMTLEEKASFYQEQVRDRHIRLGFNASLSGMNGGDITTGYLSDSDNDGLWTSMYLGGEVFRYAVTKAPDALQNCRESLEAMERLFTINNVPGFPSRSFERSGYIEQLSDPHRWQPTGDPEWDWKSTTSSDEAIGHIFVYGAMAELVDDEDLQQRSIALIDTLMQHVIDNDLYLVDFDGKPTTWGRWNPEYVNARPKMVGDRKLNASNLIAMLQTAYHFTGKEIYKEKAFELMEEHEYLDNLMRPISEIGTAPEDADDWSKMLSENWNHSDDEMYFLGYWGLYRYAFNDTLQAMYKDAIIDHWEAERPEKEGAWNLFTAMTGTDSFDLAEAVWYLQEYPLDLITWTMNNSHRKDIDLLEPNFRQQFTEAVLPPDELRISRHNANRFTLDGGNDGRSEYSAGDIWLLPYWLGRYLGVISPAAG